MMAQRNAREVAAILADHEGGPEYALVECIKCKATERIEGSQYVSDDVLHLQFEALGWSILPTLCPKHCSEEARSE